MTENAANEEFARNPSSWDRQASYEQRIVTFYDVLGWRRQIANAGVDTDKLTALRQMLLMHARIGEPKHELIDWRVTTFSDNVIISKPFKNYTRHFLQQLAVIQVSSAMAGYLIRGGVSVGDIVHDGEVVFGPALNQAYEIESTIANYPRIVVDAKIIPLLGKLPGVVTCEDGVYFVDPFTLSFLDFLHENRDVGSVDYQSPDSWTALNIILAGLKPQIRGPLGDREYEKVGWLYDRIACQIGVPPAKSYPRVRP